MGRPSHRACDLLDVVHGRNGSIGASVVSEANEAEATTAASVTVLHDDLFDVSEVQFAPVARLLREGTHSFVDLAELLELGAQGLVVGVPCEASDRRCQ